MTPRDDPIRAICAAGRGAWCGSGWEPYHVTSMCPENGDYTIGGGNPPGKEVRFCLSLCSRGMFSRRPGGWVCLACCCSTPSARAVRGAGTSRVVNERQPAQGLSRGRSAPSAVSRSHSSGTQWEILFPYVSVPQRKRPRSYWNWPTSDLPRASLFESESYFLLGPVGTLPYVIPDGQRSTSVHVIECTQSCKGDKASARSTPVKEVL